MPLAFYFDSSACTGCKACQVACKDKHNLEVGRLWRRVYEVSGGDWLQIDGAWKPSVFAYYVSIACNHCQSPICKEVCPTAAIIKRPDGIVLIDEQHCIGCQYCSWACPYGALQYNPSTGKMTKCTFCAGEIHIDLPPVCVTACPMRALDYGELSELESKYRKSVTIFPLPTPTHTDPALVISPHMHSKRGREPATQIANHEEIFTQHGFNT
jgi:anaerobic dimethyl sulfoxide reductase subunit B (iron-sulfur subunit)